MVAVENDAHEKKLKLSLPWVLVLVLVLFAGYTALQVSYLVLLEGYYWRDPVVGVLSLLPGILGVLFLLLIGFTREECFLQFTPLSKKGALFLALSFVSLAFTIPFGQWIGWDWLAGLVYAPLSGLAQELFFRATLLPVLLKMINDKLPPIVPILVHTILFGIWHIGVFWLAPWWAGILVCLVPALVGILWGWEAQKDKTIAYTVLVHSIVLLINSMFLF
jgi:membrane protease YdiL (CAAX protease family)